MNRERFTHPLGLLNKLTILREFSEIILKLKIRDEGFMNFSFKINLVNKILKTTKLTQN